MSDCAKKQLSGAGAAGFAAGTLSGLLGGSGGLLLVPGLQKGAKLPPEQVFPTAVAVMLPVTAAAVLLQAMDGPLPVRQALPYLLGGALGGWIAGKSGHRIPLRWLHRAFGLLLLWGGFRCLRG